MKKSRSNIDLKRDLFAAAEEAVLIAKGEKPAVKSRVIEVVMAKEVREKLKLNRVEFSHLLGVSERTLENWEQGRVKPSGAARSLLRVAAHSPSVVLEALR
jgi:putative transcriptional regulator